MLRSIALGPSTEQRWTAIIEQAQAASFNLFVFLRSFVKVIFVRRSPAHRLGRLPLNSSTCTNYEDNVPESLLCTSFRHSTSGSRVSSKPASSVQPPLKSSSHDVLTVSTRRQQPELHDDLQNRDDSLLSPINRHHERAIPSRSSVLRMAGPLAVAKLSSGIGSVVKSDRHDHGVQSAGKSVTEASSSGGRRGFGKASIQTLAGIARERAAAKLSRPRPARGFQEPHPRTDSDLYQKPVPFNHFAKRATFSGQDFIKMAPQAAAKLASLASGKRSGDSAGVGTGKSSLFSKLALKAKEMAAAKLPGQVSGTASPQQGSGAAGHTGTQSSGIASRLGKGALLTIASELAVSQISKHLSKKPSNPGSSAGSHPGPFDDPHQQYSGDQHTSFGFQHHSGYRQQSGFPQYPGYESRPGLQRRPEYQMHSGASPGHDPYFPFPQKRSIVQIVPKIRRAMTQLQGSASEDCVPCSGPESQRARTAKRPKALLAKRTTEELSNPLGSPPSHSPPQSGSSRATSFEAGSVRSGSVQASDGMSADRDPSSFPSGSPLPTAKKLMELTMKVPPGNKLSKGDSRPIKRDLNPAMSQVFASDALLGGTLLVIISNQYVYLAHYPEKAADNANNFENSAYFNDIILNPLRRDMGNIQRKLSPDLAGGAAFAVILTPAFTITTTGRERYPEKSKEIKEFVSRSLPQATVILQNYQALPTLTTAEVTADKVVVHWNIKDHRNREQGSSATVYYNNVPVHSKFWPGKPRRRCCGLLGPKPQALANS